MIGRFMVVLVGIACLSASLPAGGVSVRPGGSIYGSAADPLRTELLYLVTTENRVVVIDALAAEILSSVDLPGEVAGGLAVEADGTHAWIGLTNPPAVVAVDLVTMMPATPIALSGTLPPVDLALGRPGRLYASRRGNGLSVIDIQAGAEVTRWEYLFAFAGFEALAMRDDGKVLYALDSGLSPASLFAIDVSTDELSYLGEDCCHGCIGSTGIDVILSADGSTLYVANGSPYLVQVLDAVGLFHQTSSLLTGRGSNAVALSPDESRLYVSHGPTGLVVADPTTGVVLHEEPSSHALTGRGLTVAADGSWVSAIHRVGLDWAVGVQLWRTADLESRSLGSVRLRALDPVTGEPVRANIVTSDAPDAVSNWRDVQAGLVTWGPVPAGSYDIELNSYPEYEPVPLRVTVTAGEETDLGDIVLTRAAGETHPRPIAGCVSPPLLPGVTMDVRVHGKNFVDGPSLTVDLGPAVTVHSVEWENWSTLRCSVTAAPSIAVGHHLNQSTVTNPDGAASRGDFAVGPWPDRDDTADRIPPEDVQLLFVRKRPDRLSGYLFEWTEVTLQADGTPETMGDYQLSKDNRADFATADVWQETEELSYTWTPPPDGSLPPFVTFRVRARDAAGNIGP